MLELSRHIEVLLLKHDCVIVPHLGGFVTQYVSARCEQDEYLMLPPYRTVGFNSQLTLNDGLLVQSYMQTYDTSYPETIRMIDEAVESLKCTLQASGCFEFRGVGVLRLNLDGTYQFTPAEAGILSPELYGLSAVFLKPLTTLPIGTATAPKENVEEKEEKKHYTLSINRELCNYVAAAVVAVVFYFLWATPMGVGTDAGITHQAAATLPFAPASTKQAVHTPAETILTESSKDNTASLKVDTESDADATGGIPVTTATMDGGFTIVLASSVPEKNAKEYVEELVGRGLDASVFKKRKMVRVVCGSYADEGTAQSELRRLRGQHEDFYDAWVMELK